MESSRVSSRISSSTASPGFFARSPTTASCLQHTALPSLGSSRLAALSLDGCTYSAGHPPHVLVADGPDAVARSLAGADRALPTFRLSRAPRRAGARSLSTRPRRTTRSGRKSSTWARNRRGMWCRGRSAPTVSHVALAPLAPHVRVFRSLRGVVGLRPFFFIFRCSAPPSGGVSKAL